MKSTFLVAFLFAGIVTTTLSAQEVRVQGNMLILGHITDPFIGAGIGIETGLGRHFTLNADGNWGSHEHGSSVEIRPAINYYFGQELKGVFAGVALKYIALNEKEANDNWENNLYSIGFNLGFKTVMKENWTLTLVASPHKTIGGREEGNVAGMSMQLAVGYKI